MIIVALFGLGLLSVPLAGGRLQRLADLRLRRWGILTLAIVVQVFALRAPLDPGTAAGLNLFTYALGVWYLAANLHIPGMWIVAVGTGTNVLALVANMGVMPATHSALETAGLPVAGNGFLNSTAVEGARIQFFGDIFAVPKSIPLHNVFSIGDVLIVLGALVAVHRLCGSRLFPKGSRDFAELRRNRSFVSLWIAQGVSSLGDWVYTIAVAASLAGRQADPKVFATLLIVQVGPAAVMGALGGPLVDRLPRKAVMVMSDLLRGLAVASLFLVGTPSLLHFYLVGAALGLLGALSQPALQASLPNVVAPQHLVAANALVSATFNGAVMVGPVIGGILVARLGFAPAIFINGVSFLASAALVTRVFLPPQPPNAESWKPVAELREGFRYVLRTPLVRAVLGVMGLVMLAAAVKSPIEPLYVLRVLNGKPEMLGFIGGAWGVGMVLGSMLAPGAARAWRRENLLWAGIAVVGTAVVAASQADAIGPVVVLWLVAGAGNALGTVCYESLLQERTPDELRGRVLSASEAVLDAAFLGGVALAAWMASNVGARTAMTVAGTCFLAAALLSRMLLGSGDEAPVASVPRVRVDEADELLAVDVAPDVLAHAGDDERSGHGPRDDKVVGDHVAAARHVHKPGMRFHRRKLRRGDDALRLRGQGEGDHHNVGAPQRLVQSVEREGPCPTCEWLGLSADNCCLDLEGFEHAQQRLRDAARAEDGHAGTGEVAAAAAFPAAGDRALVEVP